MRNLGTYYRQANGHPHLGRHPTITTGKDILNRLKFRFGCFGLIDLMVFVMNVELALQESYAGIGIFL